jgi:hypothetical protein
VTTLAEALADAGYPPPSSEPEPVDTEETTDGTARRLAHRVAVLEAECAALAAELDADRHECDPDPDHPGWCNCRYRADSRWHRTAAWVRRRYGFGAA